MEIERVFLLFFVCVCVFFIASGSCHLFIRGFFFSIKASRRKINHGNISQDSVDSSYLCLSKIKF